MKLLLPLHLLLGEAGVQTPLAGFHERGRYAAVWPGSNEWIR